MQNNNLKLFIYHAIATYMPHSQNTWCESMGKYANNYAT